MKIYILYYLCKYVIIVKCKHHMGGDVTAEENLHGSASYIGPSPTAAHPSGQILLQNYMEHYLCLMTAS
jgi:hypothetical protein